MSHVGSSRSSGVGARNVLSDIEGAARGLRPERRHAWNGSHVLEGVCRGRSRDKWLAATGCQWILLVCLGQEGSASIDSVREKGILRSGGQWLLVWHRLPRFRWLVVPGGCCTIQSTGLKQQHVQSCEVSLALPSSQAQAHIAQPVCESHQLGRTAVHSQPCVCARDAANVRTTGKHRSKTVRVICREEEKRRDRQTEKGARANRTNNS